MEYILELLRERTTNGGFVEQDRKVLERIRKMRKLDWTVNVPERLKTMVGGTGLEYRSAAIADELLMLPTMYTEKDPSLALQGAGTQAVQGLSTKLEHFTSAALFEDCGNRASGGVPTHHRVIDAAFEGGAWSKLVLNRDVWSEYDEKAAEGVDAKTKDGKPRYADDGEDVPEGRRRSRYEKYQESTETAKQKAGVPIEWRAVDAMNLAPGYEGDVLVDVIEIQKRTLSTELSKYGLGVTSDGEIKPGATTYKDWSQKSGGANEVELIQYWDKDWCSYVLRLNSGGAGVGTGSGIGSAYQIEDMTYEHGYKLGHPPYYCSYGGYTMNFEYARLVTWSASETKRFEVEYLSWLRTIFGYLAIREAMPSLHRKTPLDGQYAMDGDTKQPRGPETIELATIYNGFPGQEIEPIMPASNADKIQVEIAQTMQDIRAQSPARKSGDIGSVGGEGFALSTIYEKDRARYNRFESGIIGHLRDVTLDFWKLCQQLDEDLYVFRSAKKDGGYVKVSPADFDTPLRPVWALHVDSTAANIIKQRHWDAMRKSEFASLDQAREAMGMNPDEVQEGAAVDRIRAAPFYQKAEEAEVLSDWVRGEWIALNDQAEKMAALPQQAMGGAGGPPNTGNLAMSPGGQGAAPGAEMQPSGMPSSPSVPTAGATAQVSQLG